MLPFFFHGLFSRLTLLLMLSCFVISGCTRDKLSVHSEYLTIESLASFYVGTPDPYKSHPQLGQRIIISWSLPKEYLDFENLHLHLKVRFRNREQESVIIPVCRATGSYFYYLLNDDYFNKDGILTYKVDLIGNDMILEEWKHQIWTELIHFEEPPSDQDCL